MDDAWQVFFVAQISASAALLGLLFVGVSLNLEKILAAPSLTRRALLALLLLLAVFVVGSAALIPGAPAALKAAAALGAGLSLAWLGWSASRDAWRHPATSRTNILFGLALTQAAALPYVVAAGLLLSGVPGALGCVAAAMIASTVKAVADAWVLLVEINR